MDKANALGDYLRARRDLVRPEDIGLIPGSRRKVPGLRREELAMPAGIAQLLGQLPVPAFVTGRYLDVLAANPLARALSPNFAPGRNVLRQLFLDPADRELHQDWDRGTASVAGGLRERAGAGAEDPQLAALVGELSIRSERFRALWARADVGHRRDGRSHLRQPVGELFLRREKLDIAGTGGLQMVIYHAEAGTESAQGLALLGSIAATAERDTADRETARRDAAEPAAPPAGAYHPEKESS
jgi:hypothetical protein